MLKTVGNPSTRYGDQTIVDGNLVIGTSGKGIDFSATPGTGTSELLDDYEEGNWTPALRSGTPTFTNQIGKYTKVGNLVTVSGRLTIDQMNGAEAYLINGLPFTPANDGLQSSIVFNTWSNLATTPVYLVGGTVPNQNLFILLAMTAGSASLGLLSVLTSGSDVYFSGSYTAA